MAQAPTLGVTSLLSRSLWNQDGQLSGGGLSEVTQRVAEDLDRNSLSAATCPSSP